MGPFHVKSFERRRCHQKTMLDMASSHQTTVYEYVEFLGSPTKFLDNYHSNLIWITFLSKYLHFLQHTTLACEGKQNTFPQKILFNYCWCFQVYVNNVECQKHQYPIQKALRAVKKHAPSEYNEPPKHMNNLKSAPLNKINFQSA